MLQISKRNIIKSLLIFLIILAITDIIYKTVNNINYYNKAKCVLSQVFDKTGFIIFEYFLELPIIVFIGIFVAALLEKYFIRFIKFFPSNTITAFLYASILPVCSCASIPIIRTMQGKLKFRVIITFLITAPLLNPYIIILSFSVIGIEYGLLRIACSFILAVSAGYILEFFYKKDLIVNENIAVCNTDSCAQDESDIYFKTYSIFKSIIIYLIIGGLIGIGLDLLLPKSMYFTSILKESFWGNLIVIIAGVPFYFCNGTDVLLLKPVICSGLPLGTAIAFSLTSTSICITSIFMLFKFMGKRLTFILIGYIIFLTLIISMIINMAVNIK